MGFADAVVVVVAIATAVIKGFTHFTIVAQRPNLNLMRDCDLKQVNHLPLHPKYHL